jgi:type 1 glutamine amidotransferase
VVLLFGSPAPGGDKFLDKITKALSEQAPARPSQPRKILIFSRTAGYRHDSIPVGIKAITMMGDKTGAYTALATEDESFFEPQKLKVFDAVFMLNTTGDCLRPATGENANADEKAKAAAREEFLKKSLVDFVSGGKGLMGTHSATDTYRSWKDYNKMMGGSFVSHPWHEKVPVKNLAPDHPLNAAFGGKDFAIADEIYEFRADTALPGERKFLLALDTKKMDVSKGTRKDGLYPVSWVATYGKGRTFYCSLGHREEIYYNPMILKHYLAGIQYVVGDLEADATPTGAGTGSGK